MNVFLTGEKNIGKSTIINRILAFSNPSYAGFRSTITTVVHGPCKSCHMIPIYSDASRPPIQPAPSVQNELFLCTPTGRCAPPHITGASSNATSAANVTSAADVTSAANATSAADGTIATDKLAATVEAASIITERFNSLGSKIIDAAFSRKDEIDLFIMDELGPAEESADTFIAKITQCLDSDTPVLGVLQKCNAKYINDIKNRNDTKIFEVTKENRDNIHIAIMSVMELWSHII